MTKIMITALGIAGICMWTGIARADNSVAPVGSHGTVDAQSARFVASHGYPALVCSPRQGGEAAAQCKVVYVRAK